MTLPIKNVLYKMAMAEQPQTPVKSPSRFIFPQMQDNPHGWGPLEVPEQFKDTPYQPFSKDDRLGKVMCT